MSRKGNSVDKAVRENLFSTQKSECFYLTQFSSINEMNKATEDSVHNNNNERIRLKLKGLSSAEYQTQALKPLNINCPTFGRQFRRCFLAAQND